MFLGREGAGTDILDIVFDRIGDQRGQVDVALDEFG